VPEGYPPALRPLSRRQLCYLLNVPRTRSLVRVRFHFVRGVKTAEAFLVGTARSLIADASGWTTTARSLWSVSWDISLLTRAMFDCRDVLSSGRGRRTESAAAVIPRRSSRALGAVVCERDEREARGPFALRRRNRDFTTAFSAADFHEGPSSCPRRGAANDGEGRPHNTP